MTLNHSPNGSTSSGNTQHIICARISQDKINQLERFKEYCLSDDILEISTDHHNNNIFLYVSSSQHRATTVQGFLTKVLQLDHMINMTVPSESQHERVVSESEIEDCKDVTPDSCEEDLVFKRTIRLKIREPFHDDLRQELDTLLSKWPTVKYSFITKNKNKMYIQMESSNGRELNGFVDAARQMIPDIQLNLSEEKMKRLKQSNFLLDQFKDLKVDVSFNDRALCLCGVGASSVDSAVQLISEHLNLHTDPHSTKYNNRKESSVGVRQDSLQWESDNVSEASIPSFSIYLKCIDITKLTVDGIVNAANEQLCHAGGIARIISDAAGPDFERECRIFINKNGRLKTGAAMTTESGRLRNCEKIINVVGPVWSGGRSNEDAFLKRAITSALEEAEKYKLSSIAIPAVSGGIYGYPLKRCMSVITKAVFEYVQNEHPQYINKCYLVHVDKEEAIPTWRHVFKETARQYLSFDYRDYLAGTCSSQTKMLASKDFISEF